MTKNLKRFSFSVDRRNMRFSGMKNRWPYTVVVIQGKYYNSVEPHRVDSL